MSLDRRLFLLLHRRAGELPAVDPILLACARYGSYGEVVLMLLLGLRGGRRGPGVVLRCLAAVGAIYLVVELIGRLAGRPRPFAAEPDARALLEHGAERSFPSRHVASGVAMAIIGSRAGPRTGRAMALLAAGMGLGRVRAGVHYPSDAAAGAVLGYAIGMALRPRSG